MRILRVGNSHKGEYIRQFAGCVRLIRRMNFPSNAVMNIFNVCTTSTTSLALRRYVGRSRLLKALGYNVTGLNATDERNLAKTF